MYAVFAFTDGGLSLHLNAHNKFSSVGALKIFENEDEAKEAGRIAAKYRAPIIVTEVRRMKDEFLLEYKCSPVDWVEEDSKWFCKKHDVSMLNLQKETLEFPVCPTFLPSVK